MEAVNTTVLLKVPLVDLHDDDDENRIVESVKEASQNWGIFQVINHEIPTEVIANLQQVGKDFFQLPLHEKQKIAKTPESGIEGYGTALNNGWEDHLFHRIWPPSAINYRYWPKNPPSYREANEEYGWLIRSVSEKLMKWLSLGLGIGEQDLREGMGGDDVVYLLKINYYPPCPPAEEKVALGVVAHTDLGALTVLIPNEVQGLQVFRDGLWYDVEYIPNALIVHFGDQIEILSKGKYKAVLHRGIVSKTQARMSWPVFLEPPKELEIGPIAKLVGGNNPAKYKTKKFMDYAYCKLNKIPQ